MPMAKDEAAVPSTTDQLIGQLGEQIEADRCTRAGAASSRQLTSCYLAHLWRRSRGRVLVSVAVACALLACLVQCDCVRFFLLSHARLFLVKAVLPLFDWRPLVADFCLVRNPLYVPPYTLRPADCDLCEATDRVASLAAADLPPDAFLADYVDKALPVVVTRDPGVAGWPLLELTLEDLRDFYAGLADDHQANDADADDEIAAYACDLRHNQPADLRSPESLLAAVLRRGWTNWVATWRHCTQAGIKAFRRLFSRPDFLPLSVSTIGSSYVLLWHSYSGNRTRRVPAPPEPNLLLLVQANGTALVRLTPKSPCEAACPQLQLRLKRGDTLAVSNRFYATEWAPGSRGFGFGFAFEGDTESF